MWINLCSPLIFFADEKGCRCQMIVRCTLIVIDTLFFGIILCLCCIDDYVAAVMVVSVTQKKNGIRYTLRLTHRNINTKSSFWRKNRDEEKRGRGNEKGSVSWAPPNKLNKFSQWWKRWAVSVVVGTFHICTSTYIQIQHSYYIHMDNMQ